MTEIDRRNLLKLSGAALALPWMTGVSGAAAQRPLFAAAYRDGAGDFGAAVFDAAGECRAQVDLPARGHDVAADPARQRVVAFARRPGNFAVCLSTAGQGAPIRFAAPEGRHFYGHGVFSSDGRVLFATENDIATGAGLIGLYDASGGFKPIAALPTGGMGPHDLALLPDGRTLVIANGGLRTHPDFGRQPLNLDSMAPLLTYLDSETGEVIETAGLERSLHQVSLRHLAVDATGQVIVGCQYKGPRSDRPDLVVTHRLGETPKPLGLPGTVARRLRHYVSSVACDASGAFAAITSSKGGIVLVLDVVSRCLVRIHDLADVSGVARGAGARGDFLLTAGTGTVAHLGSQDLKPVVSRSDLAWDNHAVRVA